MAKNYKTIALTGTEQKVVLAGQNCDIRNDSVDIVYASSEAGITSGADGVLSIPAGQAAKLLDCRGTLYILGTGSVMLCGNDYSELVFKTAATSSGEGGGTVDGGARQAIATHAGNGEIHVTATEKTAWNNKAELSDIPTTLPANGGNADTAKHTTTTLLGTSEYCEYSSILDWANNNVYNSWAFVIAGHGVPTDAPINAEAMITLETEQNDRQRKIVTWKTYGSSNNIRYRNIFNDAWYGEWFNPADGGNAALLDGKTAADFVEKRGAKFLSVVPYDIEWRGSYYMAHLGTGNDCGFYLKNETSETLDIKLDVRIESGTGYTVQYGNGTGTYPEMQTTGAGRENFSNYWISDAAVLAFTIPAGKTGYAGFYNDSGTSDISIHSVYCMQDYCVVTSAGFAHNAATLEGKPASEYVLKSEYDALAARVAALEDGT